MILCICSNVGEKDLKENPFLITKIGIKCGICIKEGVIESKKEITFLVDIRDSQATA